VDGTTAVLERPHEADAPCSTADAFGEEQCTAREDEHRSGEAPADCAPSRRIRHRQGGGATGVTGVAPPPGMSSHEIRRSDTFSRRPGGSWGRCERTTGTMARRPASRRLSAALMALTLAVIVPWPAAAYETDDLLIYLDATNPASAPGATTTWTDLSGNARHGTFAGAGPATVTFDAANQAVVFPGGTNGTAYVALAGDFADFSGGFAIEFEAEFGVSRTAWERVFDFAFAVGATADAFWVGQLAATNELTIEVWTDGAQSGYCHSATDGTALGAAGERQFQRWMITIGQDAPYLCRMYRDGIEIPTRVSPWPVNISSVGANANGSAFVLPPNTARPSGFVGRSNFIADRDLEGAIRYLRIYNRELTPVQAQANASRTVTFAANDGSGRTSTQSSIAPVALDANTFTRAGHEFLGWNREPDGSGTAYADLDVFPFVADVTLHAIWEAVAPEVPEAPGEGDGDDDAGAPPDGGGEDGGGEGTTVGARIPTRVPTGGGPIPVLPLPVGMLVATLGTLVLLTGRTRGIAAAWAAAAQARNVARGRGRSGPRLPGFDLLESRLADVRRRVVGPR
jgi:hypothetical protein